MQGFDNIINYLTPSAIKKRISSHWWSKKIDIIRAKNNVISKDKPMMKNVLILGYFEVGSCKICSTPKQLSGSKTHFCLKIVKLIVWIFEICPGVHFMTI